MEKKNNVVFCGAGAYAEVIWKQISKSRFFCDQYLAFIDSNRKLWGEYFHSLKIIPIQELDKRIIDIFVITSSKYENEIRSQLKDVEKIPDYKIYSFEEYKCKSYSQWKYITKYSDYTADKLNPIFNLNSLVIYTAIMGEYDDLKEPLYKDNNLTYVCFTNNRKLKSNIWNVEYVKDDNLSDMLFAKKIKLYPHIYFKEYETSIWIDGKFEVQSDLRNYIREYERNVPILCFPHYSRNCIYDEAAACIHLHKGKKEQIIKQISSYYHMGYPFDNGLYEMGCIVRQHNNELIKKLMMDWFIEINKYSYRDQISFPMVCWKKGILPDICDLNINKNKWIVSYVHNC